MNDTAKKAARSLAVFGSMRAAETKTKREMALAQANGTVRRFAPLPTSYDEWRARLDAALAKVPDSPDEEAAS
jgi:hypothetical protein